jgi:hypothetical protein
MRLKKEMRPYQDRIATHLYENDEKICVLRPGGGKTVVALTAIEELLRDNVIRHALVLAPKRVARVVWPDETEQWAHVKRLRYTVLQGSPVRRGVELTPASLGMRDITLVGLDVVQWLCEQLEKMPDDSPIFDLLVIDEVSRLRNPKGKRAQALAKQAKRFKMIWGLSGTLRPSSALDLFMPARVVTRGKLWGRSYYKWRGEHFYPTDRNGYVWVPFPGAEDLLHAEIAPLITTVADGELIQPEPQIIFDYVDLPADARREYDSMEKRLVTASSNVIAASAGVATGKLAQIANGFVYDETGNALPMHDEKLDWLIDLVEDATGPTIIVYEYLQDLEVIRGVLGDDFRYLGAGVSDKLAAANIEDWNAGRLPFMGLHPASGGHGLNLQFGGADMAFFSPIWSPEFWEQTIARLNRSGQTRQVMVRVCTARDTVDQMKINRVYYKMTAQEAFEAYLRQRQKQKTRAA